MNRRDAVLSALAGMATTIGAPRALAAQSGDDELQGMTFNEVVYLGVIATWIDVLERSLGAFAEYARDATANDVESEEWQSGLTQIVTSWTVFEEDANLIDPPEAFTDAAELLRDALASFGEAAGHIIKAGSSTGRQRDFDRADAAIEEGVAALEEAKDAMPYDLPFRERLDA